jgi:hypothetical protein
LDKISRNKCSGDVNDQGFDTPRGWNESPPSSAADRGDSNGDDDDSSPSSSDPTANANEQLVQQKIQDKVPEIDPKDPKNLKPIDDYHFDNFRDTMIQLEGLATRFNQLLPDALSKLDDQICNNPSICCCSELKLMEHVCERQGLSLFKSSTPWKLSSRRV